MVKYNSELKDEEYSATVNDFKELTNTLPQPAQSIAQSLLAEIYWNYYTENRWKIFNRSHLDASTEEDITTWDLKTIAEHTRDAYLNSVSKIDILQASSIADYKEILVSVDEENTKRRPTLIDFVGNRAV